MEEVKGKKSISYREAIVINGKVIKSPLFKRKTDCKQWLAEKKSERERLKLLGDHNKYYQSITIDDYSKLWLRTKEAQDVARSTLNNYERYLRVHILPFFKGKVLKLIQKNDVESFQLFLKKHHNPKGVNMIITALKGLFREAIKDEYLVKSPCEFIKSLTSDNTHEVFWTKDEINQFLKENHNHELYHLFVVALNTGLRKGELAGLCWDRVNFIENTITITRTRDKYELKERTKTKLKRVIPMNELTKATLSYLFNSRVNGESLVFLKSDDTPVNAHHIYRQFKVAQKKARMGTFIRFHDIRHTMASQFVINGGSIYDLQKILGHTSVIMTQRYAHLSMEHLQTAMKGFSLGSLSSTISDVVIFRKKENSEEVTQNPPKILNSI